MRLVFSKLAFVLLLGLVGPFQCARVHRSAKSREVPPSRGSETILEYDDAEEQVEHLKPVRPFSLPKFPDIQIQVKPSWGSETILEDEDAEEQEEDLKAVCNDVSKDMSWTIDELAKDIGDATPPRKEEILQIISRLQKRIAELKMLVSDKIIEMAATAAAVKRMLAEIVVALTNRLANAAVDTKAAVEAKIQKLNSQIVSVASLAKAKMVRAATIAGEMVFAVRDVIVDRVDALSDALATASAESKQAIQAKIDQLQGLITQLRDAHNEKAAQAFAVALAVKDMIADKVVDLQKRASKASGEAKIQLQYRIDDMQKRIDAMQISAYDKAVEIGATMNAFKELAAESLVSLGEDLVAAAGEAKLAIEKRIAMFKGRLIQIGSVMRAKMAEAAVFAQDTLVAVKDMVSENINDLRLALKDAAQEKIPQIQEGIDNLKGQLAKLQSAAGDKAAQAYAGAAAITAMIGESIVSLHAQMRDASGASKEAIGARIQELQVQMAGMKAAASAKIVDVGAFLMASRELVSVKISELNEMIRTSAAESVEAIQRRVQKLRARSTQFGKAALETLKSVVVDAGATVMAVKELLSEKIQELQERIAESAAVDKRKHQYNIRMEDMKKRLAVLTGAAGNKLAEAAATAAAFKDLLAENMQELQQQISDASAEKKKQLEEGIANIKHRLTEIGSYAMDRILEAPGMANAVKDMVADRISSLQQRLSTASSAAKVAIKEKIDQLQIKLVDMGAAVMDVTKRVARMSAEAVIAVTVMAREKIAEISQAIETASVEAKVELEARLAALNENLIELKESAADKVSEAKACGVAMAVLVGEKVAELTQQLSVVSAEKKELLLIRIDNLKLRRDAMKSSLYDTAVDVGATMNAVKELVKERVVELGEQLAVATGEAVTALKKKLKAFEGRLTRISAQVKDSLVNAGIVAAATVVAIKEMISDKLVELGRQLGSAAEARNQFWKEHKEKEMARLRDQLQSLRSAAGDRVKQAEASATAMTELVAEKLGNLRDQLEVAAEERKAELAIRVAYMEKRLNAMTAAAGDRMRMAMATVAATKEMLSENIVALTERLVTASGDALAAIKAKIILAKGRIGQIGDAMKEKMVEAASVAVATLLAIKGALQENLIEMKDRLAKASEQEKKAIQEGIANLKVQLSNLRRAAGDKMAEAVAGASAVKEMVVENIALLHDQLRTAVPEKKKQILASIEKMQTRLSEIKDSARDKVVQAAATMAAVQQIVSDQLVDMQERIKTASGAVAEAMKERIASLQTQLTSLAESAKEKAAQVVRVAAATVVAVGAALADKIVELKERIADSAMLDEMRHQAQQTLQNMEQMASQLKDSAKDAPAKAATCAVAMKDMIADSYLSLKDQIGKASADAKLKLMLRAEGMKLRIIAMRAAAGDKTMEAAATASAVKTLAAEQIVALHDKLKIVGAAAAKKIREHIASLEQNMADFGSALRDKLEEAAASIVAVKMMVAENIAKLREQLPGAANAAKEEIKNHIAKLGEKLNQLNNAAGDKAAEAIAGAAAMKEIVEDNLRAMYDHLKVASAEKKAQIEANIAKLKAKLANIGHAGYNMAVEVGATIAAAQELISESIEEMMEELDTATAERRSEIEASISRQYEKFGWLVDPFGISKRVVTSTGWMQSKCTRKRKPEDRAACLCRSARSEALQGEGRESALLAVAQNADEEQNERCEKLGATTFELASPWSCATHTGTQRCSSVYPTFTVRERLASHLGESSEDDRIPIYKLREKVQNCSASTNPPEQAACICDIANQLEPSEEDTREHCADLSADALKVVAPWACAVHHETDTCVPVYDDKSFDDVAGEEGDDQSAVDCGDVTQSRWWLDHKEFYSALFDVVDDEYSGGQAALQCRFFSKKHECLDTTIVDRSPTRPPFIKAITKTGVDSWLSNVWGGQGAGKMISLECGFDGRMKEPSAVETQQCAYSLRMKYLAKPGEAGPNEDQKMVLTYEKGAEKGSVESYQGRYALDQLWIYDHDGFIRSAADESMCLTGWSPHSWWGKDWRFESGVYVSPCDEGWITDSDFKMKWWISQKMAWDMRAVQKAGACVRPNSCCSLIHAKHSSNLKVPDPVTGAYFLKFPHTVETDRVKKDDLKILKSLKMVLEDEEHAVIDFWQPEL